MKREIIRVEPLASYLEKYKAPTSTVTRHGRDLRRSNRTPDRARAGTVEALCRDGGIIPGEHPEGQHLRHISRDVPGS